MAERRHVFNLRHKKAVKDAGKQLEKLVGVKDAKGAATALPALYKAIDKATKNGIFKKNTAARMKSRAAKSLASVT